jgi:hypothetical protein
MENQRTTSIAIQKILGHENRRTTGIYLHSMGRIEVEEIAAFEQAT